MKSLNWTYDTTLDCEVAFHNGYRIRAVHDNTAENPFEAWDYNWPIAVYYDRSLTDYEKTKGVSIRDPLSRFNDALLVMSQKHIEQALNADRSDLINHLPDPDGRWVEDESADPPKWITDARALRSWFEDAIGNTYARELLDTYEGLYKILGIPCYKTTSTGYCQGDWAEVLVVATPEAQEEFGCKEVTEADLEATADLYGYWAWGDVYGYIIEKPIFDEDGDIEDWEDACDNNSCWGYYGDDHVKSGLEEAALECVPDEPVGLPDALVEELR